MNPERATGFGEGYIPYAAVRLYCIDAELGDPLEVLLYVRAMDRAYLEYKRDKKEAERARAERQAKRK